MIRKAKLKKIFSIAALSSIALFGLTACSGVTLETIAVADHKIIEEGSGFWSRSWMYEDSTGGRQKLQECTDKGFFDKTCFETPNKTVRFEYSSSKSGLSSETITVDGFEQKADCVQTDGGWGDYRCAAIPEKPSES